MNPNLASIPEASSMLLATRLSSASSTLLEVAAETLEANPRSAQGKALGAAGSLMGQAAQEIEALAVVAVATRPNVVPRYVERVPDPEVEEARDRLARFVRDYARCPECAGIERCAPSCAQGHVSVDRAEEMELARGALRGPAPGILKGPGGGR